MKIILRKAAISNNLTHYFTGKPCKHGHISKRHTSNGQCLKCNAISSKAYKGTAAKIRENQLKYLNKNPENRKASVKKYNKLNKIVINEKGRLWNEKHPNYHKEWCENNPEKYKFTRCECLQQKHKAIPSWYETELVNQIYLKRDELSKLWGITLHVDHIVPLQGKNVCGLHCWTNLQLLESSINQSKSNKWEV